MPFASRLLVFAAACCSLAAGRTRTSTSVEDGWYIDATASTPRDQWDWRLRTIAALLEEHGGGPSGGGRGCEWDEVRTHAKEEKTREANFNVAGASCCNDC
jgi:hypothetical protein